jgi:hypothetical protein
MREILINCRLSYFYRYYSVFYCFFPTQKGYNNTEGTVDLILPYSINVLLVDNANIVTRGTI